MFESNEFDDDFFKGHSSAHGHGPSMELLLWLAAAVVASVLLAIICRCCCRGKSRGRIIAREYHSQCHSYAMIGILGAITIKSMDMT
uniref:Uncharacterized protein n=1 Tax=Heliothis virescens TaxID=7102 RepID=A0A2A4J5J0_HELVI